MLRLIAFNNVIILSLVSIFIKSNQIMKSYCDKDLITYDDATDNNFYEIIQPSFYSLFVFPAGIFDPCQRHQG